MFDTESCMVPAPDGCAAQSVVIKRSSSAMRKYRVLEMLVSNF